MKQTVRVRLPNHLSDEDLPDFVSTTIDSFYGALDVEVSDQEQSAPLDDIKVTSVALSDDAVAVNYKVKRAGRPDSDDENSNDSADRIVLGERRGRMLIFERFIPASLRRKR